MLGFSDTEKNLSVLGGGGTVVSVEILSSFWYMFWGFEHVITLSEERFCVVAYTDMVVRDTWVFAYESCRQMYAEKCNLRSWSI